MGDGADRMVVVSSDTDLLPALELAVKPRGQAFVKVASWEGPNPSAELLTVSGLRRIASRPHYDRFATTPTTTSACASAQDIVVCPDPSGGTAAATVLTPTRWIGRLARRPNQQPILEHGRSGSQPSASASGAADAVLVGDDAERRRGGAAGAERTCSTTPKFLGRHSSAGLQDPGHAGTRRRRVGTDPRGERGTGFAGVTDRHRRLDRGRGVSRSASRRLELTRTRALSRHRRVG